ncbi:hypothetical protein [Streptomyces sp. NPDC056479]|uniref:hypothetical protein n=1 Tax=unclassified Streptomyces TaxID=2593676 RepID=UPI0036BDCB5E
MRVVALHGETAFPPAWLAELEGRPTILELASCTRHAPLGSAERNRSSQPG